MSWLSSPRTSAMSSTSATPVRGVEAEILPASVFLFQKQLLVWDLIKTCQHLCFEF
jgi:hypothetical protein